MNETWWRSPEQLDKDQYKIVSLPLEGSHLVIGPPGSGKTNLLLLRASYLVRAGMPNVAIITFTRVLREFLTTGADHYPFEPERLMTFRSWAAELLRNNGINVDTKGTYSQVHARLVGGLSDLRSSSGNEAKVDCILIDEAQDYTPEEIQLMRHFANEVFAVGDNNQRIYKADGALAYLKGFCQTPAPLKFHYRNGMAICRLADGIMNIDAGGMVDTCNYDEARYPSSVQRHGGITLQQQVTMAAHELETQLIAYPDEWLGVLAPGKIDVGSVFSLLSKTAVGGRVQLQRYEDGYEALDPERRIIVSTMHSAKGLEYRANHLLAVDTITKHDNHQRLAYTAVTRSKTSLSIYHHGAIPGYFEKGLVAVQDSPVVAPDIAELFGGFR